jgi:calcineurin-like phosphoesterase family protein
MHETLIKNWNDRVKPGELVYIIGDFSFANHTLTKKVMDRLNGKKILIKGNHDMPAHKAILAGFDEVHENIFIWLTASEDKKYKVFLSHFPYRHNLWKWLKWKIMGGYWDTRYNHKRMVDDGDWLIHGHTHQRYKLRNKMIHVGVDAWDYRPVSHHEIIKLIEDNSHETIMSRLEHLLYRMGVLRGRKTEGFRRNKAKD